MRVFDNALDSFWGGKVNFVDENNVMVGYDLTQQCCESAYWFIAEKVVPCKPENQVQERDLKGYVFDPYFFRDATVKSDEDGDPVMSLDDGGMVVFRLVKEDKELFLHLYNCHNGYYSHGFEMTVDGTVVCSGRV